MVAALTQLLLAVVLALLPAESFTGNSLVLLTWVAPCLVLEVNEMRSHSEIWRADQLNGCASSHALAPCNVTLPAPKAAPAPLAAQP